MWKISNIGMKGLYWGLLCAFISFFISGCTGRNSDIIRLVNERDSLRTVAQTQNERLTRINDVMSTLGSALDSVREQESVLLLNLSGEELMSRNDVLNNIKHFEEVLKAQKEHIADLEEKLNQSSKKSEPDEIDSQMEALIVNLKNQLAEKDRMIEDLRSQLDSKELDISRLHEVVMMQQNQLKQVGEANQRYVEALSRSSDMANIAFVAIGTKKELETLGIIKKGKIQTQHALDKTKFKQVDIRKFKDIKFDAKKPKFITVSPVSSYELGTDGKGSFTLHITNPAEFWSVSNFLVIQTR